MNQVVVGVKPIAHSTEADSVDEAVGSVQTLWCIIDGHEVPGHLLASTCETSDGFMTVTLKFPAASFAAVDYRDKERYLLNKMAKVAE